VPPAAAITARPGCHPGCSGIPGLAFPPDRSEWATAANTWKPTRPREEMSMASIARPPSAVASVSLSPLRWCSRPFRWPPPGPRPGWGPSGWVGPAGRRPRLGRPRQRPGPRSPGGAGPPPPGHHRDGDRPQVLGPRGSNDPQLGPRPTAGRPADAPGGLTLTRGVPTDRRRRWRDCDVACRSRASPSSECRRHLFPQSGWPSAANTW
jgi:hypothetical protein